VIAEALRVLLFGMLGVFLVLGLIFGVIVALSRLSALANRRSSVVIPVSDGFDSGPVAPQAVEQEPGISQLETEQTYLLDYEGTDSPLVYDDTELVWDDYNATDIYPDDEVMVYGYEILPGDRADG